MRLVTRSTVRAWVLVMGLGVMSAACGSNTEATSDSASAGTSASAKKPPPVAPKRIDPLVMKTYRSDACYYGALALVQAKAAYEQSLGGAEPGDGKVPEFGLEAQSAPPSKDPPPATPSGSAKPATTGSAKPADPPKTASAKPAASGAPAASGSAGLRAPDRMAQNFRSLPYERFIRSCNVAAGLKEPSAPEFDAAVKEFADYALPLSKALQDANAYYQKGTQKEDNFAKGKELHKTITEGFGKLDEQLKKLKAATETWQKANPVQKGEYEEGQKLADKAVADANAVLLSFANKDGKAKEALATLEASAGALKKYNEDNKDKKDPWATLLPPQNTAFIDQAKQLAESTEIAPAKLVNLVTLHSRILETNHRALTRKNAGEARAPGVTPNPRNIKPRLPANHPE